MTQSPLENALLLLGRLLIAALFIHESWSKMRGYASAIAYMERFGVPGSLLPLAIAAELGCGVLLIIGWQTRWAALALAGFCGVAAGLFHSNLATVNEVLHFEKDLAIAGGLLVLAVWGAGAWSVEGRLQPS
jgi:putative oxidoreductase